LGLRLGLRLGLQLGLLRPPPPAATPTVSKLAAFVRAEPETPVPR
jgi:hypothetical protein